MRHRITLPCYISQHHSVLPLLYAMRTLPYMETLGKRLKLARQHAKFTQMQLAEKAGVAQSAVSRIEREEAETTGYVVLFAKICGVTPEWLALGEGEMLTYECDKKIKIVAHAMENLPEYKKDIIVQTSIALSELPKNNGTQ